MAIHAETLGMIPIPRISEKGFESWEELSALLVSDSPLDFKQSWLPHPESHFMPGSVFLGHNSTSLFGYAILKDRSIFNTASQKGDKTWEMGDLFEIFIQREDQSNYGEFHITPENFHLSLSLPPLESRQGISLDELLQRYWVEVPEFTSRVWIEPEQQQWRVAWKLPWTIFGEGKPCSFQWKIAFCRYDYGEKGRAPVLSSVSPLTQCSFHRPHEWLLFRLDSEAYGGAEGAARS